MVNTLNFINPSQWNRLKYSVSLGDGLSDIRGVCFDGYFFWTTHLLGTVNQWILSNGALYKVSSFDASSTLSNFTQLNGLCTDGLDLWIAWKDTITLPEDPPISTSNAYFAKWDKKGNRLTDAFDNNIATGSDGIYDLMYDNLRVLVVSSEDRIRRIDLQRNRLIEQTSTMIRTFLGMTWTGAEYAGIRNTGHGHMINYDGDLLTGQVATGLGVNSRGMDFGCERLDISGFDKMFNGEWVVVASV